MRSPDPFVPVGVPVVTSRGARPLNGQPAGRLETCSLLREDPALGESIPLERREQAVAECTARETTIPVGRWKTSTSTLRHGGIGLLVLGGLLVRRVGIEGRFGAELLGEGDLLRPWEGDDEVPTLPLATGWRVLEPTRLAILDDELHAADGRTIPQLGGASDRQGHRALAQPRGEHGDRAPGEGRRAPAHADLAHGREVGEGRQRRCDGSTSAHPRGSGRTGGGSASDRDERALSALQGAVCSPPTDAGWLLYGDPPGEFNELAAPVERAGADQRFQISCNGAPAAGVLEV